MLREVRTVKVGFHEDWVVVTGGTRKGDNQNVRSSGRDDGRGERRSSFKIRIRDEVETETVNQGGQGPVDRKKRSRSR